MGQKFSRSATFIIEDEASMLIGIQNPRLTVSNAPKMCQNKPELVPVTKKLLNLNVVKFH